MLKRLIRAYSIVNKYQNKLIEAAQAKGYDSVEALLASQRSNQIKTVPDKIQQCVATADQGKRKLDQILNLQKIKDLDPPSISEIWNSYLSEKGSLSATISSETWAKQVLNLTKYPTFLVSMPLDESFIFYFMEFSNDSIYLTKLQDYQSKGSFAEPMLQIHFYTDLLSEKNLVLMKADLLQNADLKDAQYLIYQIQYWYYIGGSKTLEIIKRFHNSPKDFDYKWITEYDYFNKC